MTSRSRRKHRITVLTIPPRTKAIDGVVGRSRRLPWRLHLVSGPLSLLLFGLGGMVSASLGAEGVGTAPIEVPRAAKPIETSISSRPADTRSSATGIRVTARWRSTSRRPFGAASADERGIEWRKPGMTSHEELAAADEDRSLLTSIGGRGSEETVRWSAFVRPASRLAPIHPFDDPFGDRTKDPATTPATGSTTPILQPSPSGEQRPPASAANAGGQLPGPRAEMPPLPPRELSPAPARPDVAPLPGMPYTNGYNNRNCDEEMDKCRQARQLIRSNPITNISLDITPLFTLANLNEATGFDEQKLTVELSKVPSRVFRDRQGNMVAEGRLADFRNGRVLVEEPDGTSAKIDFAELSDDDKCFVTAWWNIPTECDLGDEVHPGREWTPSTMAWKASGVSHKPLYFEEVQLERYGHTAGPLAQPFLSGAHFFLNIAAMPYHMGIHPPHECQYPLGYYRPGNCAPWLVPPIPLSVRSGLLTAGLYTGGVFFIP